MSDDKPTPGTILTILIASERELLRLFMLGKAKRKGPDIVLTVSMQREMIAAVEKVTQGKVTQGKVTRVYYEDKEALCEVTI